MGRILNETDNNIIINEVNNIIKNVYLVELLILSIQSADFKTREGLFYEKIFMKRKSLRVVYFLI